MTSDASAGFALFPGAFAVQFCHESARGLQTYTFVDTAYLHGRAPEKVAQQLCDGGSDLIQLRAKGASPDEIRRLAETILPITRRAGVGLVINDHLAVARDVGAEFCHLGQEDFFEAGHTHVSDLRPAAGHPAAPRAGHSAPAWRRRRNGETRARGRRSSSPSARSRTGTNPPPSP